ncbi:MAG: NADH-quinone oxidoreductase subunit D [Limnochordaceae bacterium]|nr:NADH-quinone oxidoreductase subunit D [Limnochordaceae bacterium]
MALDTHSERRTETLEIPGSDLPRTEEMMVNMGPQHPSTHGVLRAVLTLDGERIVDVDSDVGYLHRCFEKICEQQNYPQIIPYTDRTDYLAGMTNELALVLTVEKAIGLEVPRRAQYIRTIMAELQRIHSHLIWFGTFALDMGATTPFLYSFRERETISDFFEEITGARMMYNYMRYGGVRNDITSEWVKKVQAFLKRFPENLQEYDDLFTGNPIVHARTQGIGKISAEQAIAYGASGPVLRATGVPYDIRRADPYLVYDELQFDIATASEGDVWARYQVRMQEMRQSVRMLEQLLAGVPEGEIMGKAPRIIKVPAGHYYGHVDSPRGEVGCYLVSTGERTPYRLHWRSPCFVHLQLLPLMAKGHLMADMVAIIGSIDIVMGEVDR